MAKIVITTDRGVWRVSLRVLNPRGAAAPGLLLARAMVRLVAWPVLFVLCLLSLRPWRVEARTVEGLPVVWYVRGTFRARRVAREVIVALMSGRSFDDVLRAARGEG